MLRLLRFMFGIDAIDSRWMAYLLTASVAHACFVKGVDYLEQYPGWLGWLLFALSPLTAVVIGINLITLVKRRQADRSGAAQHTASGNAGGAS